ncbi:hypothetical protein JCM16106_04380 [Hydrogenophilus islandicus]
MRGFVAGRRRWLAAGLATVLSAIAAGGWALWSLRNRKTVDHEESCSTDLEGRTPPHAYDPQRDGPDPLAPRTIPETARCPICGMYPARYPRWAAQRIDEAGRVDFYDAPRDLVIHDQWLRQAGEVESSRKRAVAIWVRDYCRDEPTWIAGEQAWFVFSPQLIGPMGRPEPAACGDETSARALAMAKGGELLRLADLYEKFRW